MGLLGVWNINLLRLPTLAILPYDSRLARFPAFLQQLDMESNGKRVGRDGAPLARETAPVVWGEPGNNAQHSFFQLLHQGTPRAALDFLLPARSSCGNEAQHELAIANCLAQADVFMRGQEGGGVPPQRVHEGSRPSSLLLFPRLDPRTLGALIARLRAQGVRAERALGHQLLRPVGRRARQEGRDAGTGLAGARRRRRRRCRRNCAAPSAALRRLQGESLTRRRPRRSAVRPGPLASDPRTRARRRPGPIRLNSGVAAHLRPPNSGKTNTLRAAHRFLGASCCALLLGMSARPASADPWLGPGDVALRHDIELLADAGILRTPGDDLADFLAGRRP